MELPLDVPPDGAHPENGIENEMPRGQDYANLSAASEASAAEPASASAEVPAPARQERGRSRAATPVRSAPASARINALYSDAGERRERLQRKINAATPVSTFTPEITDRARRRSSSAARLYDRAHQEERKRELEAKRMAQETSECTFTPQVNPSGPRRSSSAVRLRPSSQGAAAAAASPSAAAAPADATRARPTSARLNGHSRGGSAAAAAVNGGAASNGGTATPPVNGEPAATATTAASATAPSAEKGHGSAYKRLYEAQREREVRLARLDAERRQVEAAQCTFRPDISATAGRSASAQKQ
ncbi:unnamed protein product, partial [Phaeothamnion confervicola]